MVNNGTEGHAVAPGCREVGYFDPWVIPRYFFTPFEEILTGRRLSEPRKSLGKFLLQVQRLEGKSDRGLFRVSTENLQESLSAKIWNRRSPLGNSLVLEGDVVFGRRFFRFTSAAGNCRLSYQWIPVFIYRCRLIFGQTSDWWMESRQ